MDAERGVDAPLTLIYELRHLIGPKGHGSLAREHYNKGDQACKAEDS